MTAPVLGLIEAFDRPLASCWQIDERTAGPRRTRKADNNSRGADGSARDRQPLASAGVEDSFRSSGR